MGAGYVGILAVELHFPEAGSLKGKRKHVKSAKAQLQNRFGASVAEVDHHELWQRAGLTVDAWRVATGSSTSCSTGPSDISRDRSGSWCGRSERSWSSVTDRMRKVNELLREVLSEAVLELEDPRIGFVTVTAWLRRGPSHHGVRQRVWLRTQA